MSDNSTPPSTRLFVIGAILGGVIIVIGNAMAAAGPPNGTNATGTGIRQLGLLICIFSGMAFVLSRYTGRLRAVLGDRLPNAGMRRDVHRGLSPFLCALLRLYAIGLVLLGGYMVVTLGWQVFYQGGSVPWVFVYALVLMFTMIAPGFLLWGVTSALRRTDDLLVEVASRVELMERRLNELSNEA